MTKLPVVLSIALTVVFAACSSSDDDAGGTGPGGTDNGSSGNVDGNGNTGGNGGGGGTGGGGGDGDPTVTAANVTTTTVTLGSTLTSSEDEVGLAPVVLSPLPDGSARIAWMGNDGKVHVTKVDGTGKVVGPEIQLPAHDLADMIADANGGVVLLSRDAEGGGTLNCGQPTNLCGTPPSPPVPCYDQYLVRFDEAGEKWATKMTSSSAALPPYSTSATGPTVYMVWWYAHHGRIATDGTRFAAYFGDAISVSQNSCINIHQGDRMQIVDGSGAIVSGGFELGCSHSGYERIVWDARSSKFVTVCKTDNQNRIAFAPNYGTIRPVDLAYSNFGDFVVDPSKAGYWGVVSDIRDGQPAAADGLAEVHLMHFDTGKADADVVVTTGQGMNERAPHVALYGKDHVLVEWEQSSKTGDLTANDKGRQMFVQARKASDGSAVGEPLAVTGRGNRYQSMVTFPDGSVRFLVAGPDASSMTLVKVAAP